VELVFGGGRLDRRISGADELLLAYREDSGSEYLDYQPNTRADVLVAEDLAVTTLINSRFGMAAVRSLARQGGEIDLAVLPEIPLEETSKEEREQVARLVATVAAWPGFAASVATKVLHKKRPRLIPILDNQAIFGAYMNPRWPQTPSRADSVKAQARINEALDWIAFDLTRRENARVWLALEQREPSRSRIQLFDSIWWMHFRQVEPAGRPEPPQTEMRASERATERVSAALESGDAVLVFADNDDGYLAWLDSHPTGFVLNSFRRPKPTYSSCTAPPAAAYRAPRHAAELGPTRTSRSVRVGVPISRYGRPRQPAARLPTAGGASPLKVDCLRDLPTTGRPIEP
jgi:hypothetical protein